MAELAVTDLASLCLVFPASGEAEPDCVSSAAANPADSFQSAVATGQHAVVDMSVPVSDSEERGHMNRCFIAPMVARNRTLGALVFVSMGKRRQYGPDRQCAHRFLRQLGEAGACPALGRGGG